MQEKTQSLEVDATQKGLKINKDSIPKDSLTLLCWQKVTLRMEELTCVERVTSSKITGKAAKIKLCDFNVKSVMLLLSNVSDTT